MPDFAPRMPPVDFGTHYRQRQAVQNIAAVYNHADPKTRAEGRQWYDRVNEATSKDVRGTSTSERGGAGIVAAVSPSMDWENNNLDAVHELHGLRENDWKKIAGGDRSPVQGMSMSRASTDNLLKAHRIIRGEDPDDVLDRRTAPKTNSFFHNIAEPDKAGPVTIDGRAHDIAANRLQGWEQHRGISSAATSTGKTTRYEHLEKSYRVAAHALNTQHGDDLLPHQVQAVTWEHAKSMEKQGLTKSGQPRKIGVRRVGQPYFGPGGLSPKP
jgi:hypothetical protein